MLIRLGESSLESTSSPLDQWYRSDLRKKVLAEAPAGDVLTCLTVV